MTGHKFRRPDKDCISHAELKLRFEYVGKAGLRRKDSRRGKTGNVNTTGYVRVQIDGKSYLMHRLVVFYHTGKWPLEVNHKKRNKRNNAIENLEDSTRKANQTHALGKPCAAFVGSKKVAVSKEKYYSLGGRDKIGSKTIVKNDSIFGLNKKERIFWAYTNSGKNGWIHYFFDL